MKGKRRYLIRLDDACPTMASGKWGRIEDILDRYGIRPMVGIVPDNQDEKLKVEPADEGFWAKAKEWQDKGWTIALHGCTHLYHESKGGLNPLWNKSEFVGLSYEAQLAKLTEGLNILKTQGLNVEYFFAPSHTFDENTVKALSDIGISKISDTIAFEPYESGGVTFIPQLGGRCRMMPLPGTYTFCFHPNTMEDADFGALAAFLSAEVDKFMSFSDMRLEDVGRMSVASRLLRAVYFLRRRAMQWKRRKC